MRRVPTLVAHRAGAGGQGFLPLRQVVQEQQATTCWAMDVVPGGAGRRPAGNASRRARRAQKAARASDGGQRHHQGGGPGPGQAVHGSPDQVASSHAPASRWPTKLSCHQARWPRPAVATGVGESLPSRAGHVHGVAGQGERDGRPALPPQRQDMVHADGDAQQHDGGDGDQEDVAGEEFRAVCARRAGWGARSRACPGP